VAGAPAAVGGQAAGGTPNVAGAAGAGPAGGSNDPPIQVEEAIWSHTDCDKPALAFPDIDKNEGVFPIGSCPPPEDLFRGCGAGSKIPVMTAAASSYETGYWHPPEYAHDEHLRTRWSSNSGETGWLTLDLGSAKAFKRLYLAWELAHGGDYDIQVSDDGQSWMTVKEVRGGDGYQDIVDVEATARHIRINGVARGTTDTGGEVYGYSLFDVTICGELP
jgi:hypothetical protein